jgi:hypothetical protein
MPYEISAGNIIEIQIVGRLHSQRTRTTFHYRCDDIDPGNDGVTELEYIEGVFDSEVASPIRTALSEEWVHEYNTIQRIHQTRQRTIAAQVNVAGAVAQSSCPSTTAVVIRRFTEQAGRRYQGRIYLPGVPVTHEQDSRLNPLMVPLYTAISLAMEQNLDGGPHNSTWVPIVSKLTPNDNRDNVADTFVDTVLRAQRRRQIGVGE